MSRASTKTDSNAASALTVVKGGKQPPAAAGKIKLMREFDAARKHVANIENLGRRTVHESILLGHSLNQAKELLGTKRGGDHTSEKAKSQSATLLPWRDLVEQQTGYSYDTCQRCMLLATGAKKHIAVLTAPDVLKKPLSALPKARQEEVVKALKSATDGQTFGDLMDAFGVTKAKKPHGPPKPTKQSAETRVSNQQDEALQQQALMDLSEEHITSLEQITLAAAYKALDTDRLSVMEQAIDGLKKEVAAELANRRKAK